MLVRFGIALSCCLLAATPVVANHITPPFLSTVVNPFGVPAVGTGIAVFAETSGLEAVTAQNWLVTGNIVNNDAPGSAGFLTDPPRLQRQNETGFADFFDPFNTPWGTNDSYWGSFFTTALLGAGFNGSGTANPVGAAISTMELVGGTNFGSNPAASELLLYVVITAPVTIQGELAIGAGTLEVLPPSILELDGDIVPIPEPTSFSLAGLSVLGLLGFAEIRRRFGRESRNTFLFARSCDMSGRQRKRQVTVN